MQTDRRSLMSGGCAAAAIVAAGVFSGGLDAQSVHRARAPITVGPDVQVSKTADEIPHHENLAIADPDHPGRMITCAMASPLDVSKVAEQYCYVTFDGGATWEPSLKVTEGHVNGDPTAVYGRGSDLYVVSLVVKELDEPRGPEPDAPQYKPNTVVFKSADGGRTWAEASRFQFIDREFIMIDETGGKYDGRLYVVGQGGVRGIGGISDGRAPSLQIFRSVDGGQTFNGPVHAAYPEGTAVNGVGTGAVLSDGTVAVMFSHTKRGRTQRLDGPGPNAELHVITSIDGGETFERSSKITDWAVDRPRSEGGILGQLAADPGSPLFKDRLYAVWPALVSGRLQVQFAWSSDKGKTWSKPVVVNDDRSPEEGGKGPDHLLPSVGVNKDGVVLVTWYDRREAKDNLGWRLRAAASLDGGQTFSASVPVADAANSYPDTLPIDVRALSVSDARKSLVTLDLRLHTFFTSGGHTTGLAVDAGGTFHPTWVDNRTGIAQLWSASVKVDGTVTKHGASELTDLEDVSKWVTFELTNSSLDRATGKFTVTARLKNHSKHTIVGPVKVRVLTLEPALGVPRITNADNNEEGTGAIWNFTAQLAGKPLAPMKLSEPRTLTFAISDLRPLRQGRDLVRRVMTLDARIFAKLQKMPETTDEKTKSPGQ